MKTRISDAIYAKTEPDRHRCECKETARIFHERGYEDWEKHLKGVALKRGPIATKKLKDCVEWLWVRRKEKLKEQENGTSKDW